MRSERARDVNPPTARRSVRPRVVGALVAGPCLAVLAAAFWLTAEPGGMGTHRQLHLLPCSFLARTGWPCPACGMTTAFAAMAHGQFRLAAESQAFGVVLFLATAAGAAVGAVQAASGKAMLERVWAGARWWWLGAIVAMMLTGWGLKAYIGWSQGAFPLR